MSGLMRQLEAAGCTVQVSGISAIRGNAHRSKRDTMRLTRHYNKILAIIKKIKLVH